MAHTAKSIIETCQKFKTRKELQTNANHVYRLARANGLEDAAFAHLVGGRGAYTKRTFEDCEKSAKKYNNLSAFYANDHATYQKARREGWLNKICAHMTACEKLSSKETSPSIETLPPVEGTPPIETLPPIKDHPPIETLPPVEDTPVTVFALEHLYLVRMYPWQSGGIPLYKVGSTTNGSTRRRITYLERICVPEVIFSGVESAEAGAKAERAILQLGTCPGVDLLPEAFNSDKSPLKQPWVGRWEVRALNTQELLLALSIANHFHHQ